MLNTYILKTVLSLMPIIIITGILIIRYNKTIRAEQKISERFNKLNTDLVKKTVSKSIDKKDTKNSHLDSLLSKLHVFGIDLDVHKMTIFCIVGYLLCALVSYLIIGAGPLLMIYMGCIFLAVVFTLLNNTITKRKKELRDEFMEKIRDISSQMSVGLSFTVALEEAMRTSHTSPVMLKEFDRISQNIYTGKTMSESFMDMYKRLNIEEIKELSTVLEVFEITGGKLTDFLNSFTESYMSKMKIQNEKEVFLSSIKSSQMFIIGIPVLIIIVFSLLAPNIMKGYYGSIEGQLVGIVLVTVILIGSFFSVNYIKEGD